MQRRSAILLPLSSLPSSHGIGSLGQAAYDFIDFLAASQQSYWQMLPLCPLGSGNSPYASYASAAGEPCLIDLDLLVQQGWLSAEEVAAYDKQIVGDNPRLIHYPHLHKYRLPLLEQASRRCWQSQAEQIEKFAEENRGWLDDYALYMALKRPFQRPWYQWPEEIRQRQAAAMVAYRVQLDADVRLFTGLQYLFQQQWQQLKQYAQEKGIGMIGDLPIYVALDSADVWAEPQWFQLDAQGQPQRVAGCPPDKFSPTGQRWGNPLYDWEKLRADGYGWWLRRIAIQAARFEILRIDHFRGLESYFAIPADAQDAQQGEWLPGPGANFLQTICQWFPNLQLLAEDLGHITEAVQQLRESCSIPGMKVLQFAFDTPSSPYLPHQYPHNCACYSSTHDTLPLAAWWGTLSEKRQYYVRRYLGLNEQEGIVYGLLRGGMSSVADLFVAQMQDWLALGASSRINTPGVAHGNWRWRLLPSEANSALALRIADMTRLYGRA